MSLKKSYLLMALCLSISLSSIAQTAPPYPKEQWGKLSKDGKTYVSEKGTARFSVGDSLMLGHAESVNNTFYNIRYTAGLFHNALNPNTEFVDGKWAGKVIRIEKIVTTKGLNFFDAPVAYLYFHIPGTVLTCEMSIEASLEAREFEFVKK